MEQMKLLYRLDAYRVLPDSPQMQQDFLQAMASLARILQIPCRRRCLQVARANNLLPVAVAGFEEFPEKGVGGLVQFPNEQRPRAVLLGSRGFLMESGLQTPTFWKWQPKSGTRRRT